MRYACFILLAAALAAQEPPRIVYSKAFPKSNPPFVSVTVEKSGKAEYKEAPDDPHPIGLQLSEAETAAIFGLAEKLGHFNRPLESGLKVANMGIKSFRYESGGQNHEVKFNYSQDPDAELLADWFERITETVQHSINLEKAARFDRLGVDSALIQLQVSVERRRLAGATVLLPMLDRVAKGSAYMNRARERAATIAEYIRAGKPKSE